MRVSGVEAWIYTIGSVLIVASALTLNAIAIVLGSAALVASIAIYRGWYIIEPLVIRSSGAIEVLGDYELSYDRSCATRRVGKAFCSTAAACLGVGREPEIDRRKIEGVIARLGFPFRVTMSIETLGTQKIMDDLKTRLHSREIALSRIENRSKGRGQLKAMQLEKEIEVIKGELSAIASAGTPLRLSYYAMTSAMSEYRHMAEESAMRNLRSLTAEFSGLLGEAAVPIGGTDLLNVLRIDAGVSYG